MARDIISLSDLARCYRKQMLWVVTTLLLAGLLILQVSGYTVWAEQVMISAVFSFVAGAVYGALLGRRLSRQPKTVMPFFLKHVSLRVAAAAFLMIDYAFLVPEKVHRLAFVIILAIFFIVMLVFDCVHILRVENKVRESVQP